jgi:hypothetical protein
MPVYESFPGGGMEPSATDSALPGLRDAMRLAWRGGAFALTLDDGVIRLGDSVILRDRTRM